MPEEVVSYCYSALDLEWLEALFTTGLHIDQASATLFYIREAPQYKMRIKAGDAIIYSLNGEKLTKEAWFDKLIERAMERQARLFKLALEGSFGEED